MDKIWEVDVTETKVTRIYVEADSKDKAIETAEELIHDVCDRYDSWIDSSVHQVSLENVYDRYWSGGPDGKWVYV